MSHLVPGVKSVLLGIEGLSKDGSHYVLTNPGQLHARLATILHTCAANHSESWALKLVSEHPRKLCFYIFNVLKAEDYHVYMYTLKAEDFHQYLVYKIKIIMVIVQV